MTYKVKLARENPDLLLNNLLPNLQALFDTLLHHTRQQYGEQGIARIYIDHPKLESPIIVRPKYLWELSGTEILEVIDNVLHSAGNIPADDELDINIAIIKLMKGSGRKAITNIKRDTVSKRCFITIRNDDLMCLPRAIVVGVAHLKHYKNKEDANLQKEYDRIRKKDSKYQTEQALLLLLSAGIPVNRIGISQDIPIYEDLLGISICLFSSQVGNQRVYNGQARYKEKIFLYHYEDEHGGHFDVLTKQNQLMCTPYYCDECGKGFKNATQHNCKKWCNICGKECIKNNPIKCNDCNRICRSQQCFLSHKKTTMLKRGLRKGEETLSQCAQFWECPTCGITLQKKNRDPSHHECGESKCSVCHEYFINRHRCYMRAQYSEKENSKFIFYDFECYVKNDIHVPNYVMAMTVCSMCENESITEDSICYSCGSRCLLCNKFNKRENEFECLPCYGCGKRQVVFQGENTKSEFCQWLLQDQHSNFTAIAHNSKAYDAYFIYNYLLENSIIPEPIIFSGSKIMYMKVGRNLNMRIIDSLNFLPMPLANFPKCFELDELKKGFFPHYFNIPENQEVVLDKLPDVEYYDPDSMSSSHREEFMIWYNREKNNYFDFKKEIHQYCVSDVKILMEGCMKFRKLVMSITGDKILELNPEEMVFEEVMLNSVDPMSFLTIASVCLGIFRSKFLPENWKILSMNEHLANPECLHEWNCNCTWLQGRKKNAVSPLEVLIDGVWTDASSLDIKKSVFLSSPIALIPPHGYNKEDNHSKQSLEWLSLVEKIYEEKGHNIQIQHARSAEGEKNVYYRTSKSVICYKLDGYFELGNEKYACEFYGCNWHGCPKCYIRDRHAIVNNGKSLALRYNETMLKEKRLKEMGFTLITKWSCEFKIDLVQKPQWKNYIKHLNIVDSIDLRDCYFGGRTNALILYKQFSAEEKGRYVDFCSLYPDILKYQKFPVGHPEKILKNFNPITYEICEKECPYISCPRYHVKFPYFGIVKAKFLPPNQLLHPVLPVRCNNKLKFPLCYKCAMNDTQTSCSCNDHERAFIQTYCTSEVDVALNMGYKILEIYEVLHWKNYDMYDVWDQQGGLFTDYINTFLKIKQESSGLPENVNSENVHKFIDSYRNHEGIHLIATNIKRNPGLRGVSKLALNSFYGKFGQRTNLRKTKLINDVGVLYDFLTDKSKEIVDFHIMNENVIELEFKNSDDFEPLSSRTNVVIAAFCTSWARLKLWFVMDKLGSRVLYHDTDSFIFSSAQGEDDPKLGNYLGDLTDELTCKNIGCKKENCEGHWIQEFISCGPKNYSFKLNTGEVVCKVRGFSLNYSSSKIINFDSMKSTLDNWLNKTSSELITVKTEIRKK